jgi:outer membrane protein assembly factor BamB
LHISVLNANGTLRWSRSVADAGEENPPATDRVDAAIAPDGRVIVVFDANNQYPDFPGTGRVILGRMFSATGVPVGPIFRVSEKAGEFPPDAVGLSRHPRVTWRDDVIAVV